MIETKKYSYSEVKAICEVIKYADELDLPDYDDVIPYALELLKEWKRGVKKGWIFGEELGYEQAYFARRVQEQIKSKKRGVKK